jgi:hypothetical protein
MGDVVEGNLTRGTLRCPAKVFCRNQVAGECHIGFKICKPLKALLKQYSIRLNDVKAASIVSDITHQKPVCILDHAGYCSDPLKPRDGAVNSVGFFSHDREICEQRMRFEMCRFAQPCAYTQQKPKRIRLAVPFFHARLHNVLGDKDECDHASDRQ